MEKAKAARLPSLWVVPDPKGQCKNKIRLSGGILTPGRPPFEARQIRSPKSEIRNKFKIGKFQGSKRREAGWFCDSEFGPSGLFRISSFGFRILDKVTIPLRNDSENPDVIFAQALSDVPLALWRELQRKAQHRLIWGAVATLECR